MFDGIKKFALDILFPISCLSCGAPDLWLCPACLKRIDLLSFQVCPYCEKAQTASGAICSRCKANFIAKNTPPFLDNMIVATSYNQANISRLVHAFKYSFVRDLGFPLSTVISQAIFDNHLPLPDFIIPVPLHPRRLRWRGFNQAEVLAQDLSENLSPGLPIPLLNQLVIRKKFTPPQMKIKNYSERKKNMQNSFCLADSCHPKKETLRNKKILLVDDISTTGSTLLECAKVLKSAGAGRIYAAVIARQEMK